MNFIFFKKITDFQKVRPDSFSGFRLVLKSLVNQRLPAVANWTVTVENYLLWAPTAPIMPRQPVFSHQGVLKK
jgi:hypothetical protein